MVCGNTILPLRGLVYINTMYIVTSSYVKGMGKNMALFSNNIAMLLQISSTLPDCH